jgi:hypothetical protein
MTVHFEESAMQTLGPYLVGVAFWLFLGVCAVAGIVADYKRRRMGVEVVRTAIEKGTPLDPALIEQLTSTPSKPDQGLDPTLLKLGGIITIASGIGLCPGAWLVSHAYPPVLYPTLGLAILAICVGGGLLVGAGVVSRALERRRAASALS